MQKTLKTDTQGGEKALSSFLIKKATTEEKPFLLKLLTDLTKLKSKIKYVDWNIMTVLKIFCFCFNPKTGSVVLGCLGVILSVLLIVPPCLILESHDYYFGEFIKQQKAYGGKQFFFLNYTGCSSKFWIDFEQKMLHFDQVLRFKLR